MFLQEEVQSMIDAVEPPEKRVSSLALPLPCEVIWVCPENGVASNCHFKREHDDENMVFLCFPMFSEHVQTKPATISNPKRNPWIYLGGGCPRCLKAFSGRMQNSTSKPLSIPMDPHFFNWLIPPSLLDPHFWPVQRPYFCVSFSSCDCFSRIFAVENAFQHVPAILVDFEG